jgi:hypothetical protein
MNIIQNTVQPFQLLFVAEHSDSLVTYGHKYSASFNSLTKTSKKDAQKCAVAQLAQDKRSLQHQFRTVYDTEFRQFVPRQFSAHGDKSYSRFTVLSPYRQKIKAGVISAHIAFPAHLSRSLFTRMSLMQVNISFLPHCTTNTTKMCLLGVFFARFYLRTFTLTASILVSCLSKCSEVSF